MNYPSQPYCQPFDISWNLSPFLHDLFRALAFSSSLCPWLFFQNSVHLSPSKNLSEWNLASLNCYFILCSSTFLQNGYVYVFHTSFPLPFLKAFLSFLTCFSWFNLSSFDSYLSKICSSSHYSDFDEKTVKWNAFWSLQGNCFVGRPC